VKAEARANEADLTWDPPKDGTPDKYRVYVGEESGNYAYNLDTDQPTPQAQVTGLKPGATYYFAITALQGDRESEKSAEVTAVPLGLTLAVTPKKEALFIEWAVQAQMPIGSFTLEYGVAEDDLSEKRIIPGGDLRPGAKRSLTLRDLLPGVTYSIRLTPVTTTGDPIQELVNTAQGTPESDSGFHPAAGDPLPFLPAALQDLVTGAPQGIQNVASGVPPMAWYAVAAIALAFATWRWNRHRMERDAIRFLQRMEAHYHRS